MHKRSKFSSLSQEDQQKIFSLWGKHTYKQMVEIIAKPRPEGLALKTSVTALCRFNVNHNPALHEIEIDRQLAHALQVRGQASGNAMLCGIISLVEQRVFKYLSRGDAVENLMPQLRVITTLNRTLISRDKWQQDQGVDMELAVEDYRKNLERESDLPDFEPLEDPDLMRPASGEDRNPESGPVNTIDAPAVPTNETLPSISTEPDSRVIQLASVVNEAADHLAGDQSTRLRSTILNLLRARTVALQRTVDNAVEPAVQAPTACFVGPVPSPGSGDPGEMQAAAEAALAALRRGVFSETQLQQIAELQAEIARNSANPASLEPTDRDTSNRRTEPTTFVSPGTR
jgi:hypothetical protein